MGLSASTYDAIGERAHIRQSLVDILTTPVGSRVLVRDYGSRLPALVDRPLNAQTRLDVMSATAEAVGRWEPRIRLSRVSVERAEAGRLEVGVFGTDAAGGPLAEDGILV